MYYETPLILELRGVLNREEHADLLPEVDEEERRPVVQKRPPSEFMDIISIDLTNDNEVITMQKRVKRPVVNLD